jgi:paired amphipathic helix protein Sin3a
VNKIKNRYSGEPETYKQFLEILQAYQREQKPIQEVFGFKDRCIHKSRFSLKAHKICLKSLNSFYQTLALPSSPVLTRSRFVYLTKQNIPTKKQARRQVQQAVPPIYGGPPASQTLPPPKKRIKVNKPDQRGTPEELEFFEKARRVIGNQTTYNEFLKVLNLFSQQIVDAKALIARVEPFLGKSPELFNWFKKFVKYEDNEVIFNIPAERPDIDLHACRKSGHSYRRLPKNVLSIYIRFHGQHAADAMSFV